MAEPGPKVRVHAGAHRPLHPNPTRYEAVRAEHCPRSTPTWATWPRR